MKVIKMNFMVNIFSNLNLDILMEAVKYGYSMTFQNSIIYR